MWNIFALVIISRFHFSKNHYGLEKPYIYILFLRSPSKQLQFMPDEWFSGSQKSFSWKVAVTSADDGWHGKGRVHKKRTNVQISSDGENMLQEANCWKYYTLNRNSISIKKGFAPGNIYVNYYKLRLTLDDWSFLLNHLNVVMKNHTKRLILYCSPAVQVQYSTGFPRRL